MNAHSEYRRHGYQPPEPPQPQPKAEELARHRDPSVATDTHTPAIARKRIAWVRPTELASYAGPTLGRGIDLHAEFVRRARRAPITTARAMRHPAPTTSPPRIQPTNRAEGLQL